MTYTPHQAVVIAAYETFGIGPKDLTSHVRTHDIAHPRQACMYALRDLSRKMSLPMIGRLFNRDHTTVIHAIRATEARVLGDPDFAKQVDRMHQRAAELCAPPAIFGPRGNPKFKTRRNSE